MEQYSATGGIRIPLVEDRRIFTPLARSSYKWKTFYKKRTAVERVNARLDEAYGFEKHFIRGFKKMKLRCGLALMVMPAMAVGRLRQKQGIGLRSLGLTGLNRKRDHLPRNARSGAWVSLPFGRGVKDI